MSASGSPAIGIVTNRSLTRAHDLARDAARWLGARGHHVRVPAADAERVGLPDLAVSPEEFATVDVALSIGGDGTMLHTIEMVDGSDTAVLGVNAGHLGYLTEIEPDDLVETLERLVAREYAVVERMMLAVTVQSAGPAGREWSALNEMVLEKASSGKTVNLEVAINGSPFTTYVADALIVATPTGSTAYSFSAGGPIVSPQHDCMILNPVAAHMLFDRALIFDPDEELRLEAIDRTAVLSIDGRDVGTLEAGDVVRCTAGAPARLVTFGGRDFHQILKTKFGLSDR